MQPPILACWTDHQRFPGCVVETKTVVVIPQPPDIVQLHHLHQMPETPTDSHLKY